MSVARRRRRPVLVLPGYGAGDTSTTVLRAHLAALGHPVHRWALGTNEGPTPEILQGLEDRFDALADGAGRPVSLVGWSLGGVYACALARHAPEHVRCVVTLGSPLRSAEGPLPRDIPLTSVWTRRDGIVAWRDSAIDAGPGRENVEVHGNHITLGFDPLVAGVVADRLGLPDGQWSAFKPPRWLAGAYPRPAHTTRSGA